MLIRAEVAQRGFLITAIAGLITAGLRLLNELNSGDVCPQLGPIPFCAIVLVSYLPIVIYAAKFPQAPKLLFLVGGFPAVFSPLAGSLGELRSPNVNFCGSSLPGGVPDCFILASLSILLLLFFTCMNIGKRVESR